MSDGNSANPYLAQPASQPAAPPPGPPQPAKKSSIGCILIVLAIVGGGGVLLCCGGGGFMAWFGTRMLGEVVTKSLKDHPVIKEHLGELESMSIDFSATGENNEQDTIVFQAKGSKGTGTLYVKTNQGNGDKPVESARLKLPNGQIIPIDLNQNPNPNGNPFQK